MIALAGLLVALSGQITDEANGADAQDNLEAGYNLAYFGVLSFDDATEGGAAGLTPSNYREPLPIWAIAAYVRLHPALATGHTADTLNAGAAVRTVKAVNLVWAALCLVGVAALCLVGVAVRPPLLATGAALVAMGLVYVYFLSQNKVINLLYTELEAATLLVWFAVTTTLALRGWRWGWFAASGVFIGLLALTKAVFLYVAVGVVGVLLVVYVWRPAVGGRWGVVARLAVFSVALAATVLPWMTRNAVLFGDFGITQRGGVILMIRAYLDGMTHEEWVGGFYHYSTPGPFKDFLGAQLGFTPQDEFDGRLMRLNRGNAYWMADREADRAGKPEDAVSYYRAGRAERVRLQNQFEAAGHPNPTHAADDALQTLALERILADPVAHLKVSVLMAWRGLWGMATPAPLALAAVGVLFGMTGGGLWRRDPYLLGAGLAPFGAYLFYALFTHFITRYLEPMAPLLLANTVIVGTLAGAALWGRLARRRAVPAASVARRRGSGSAADG